MSEVASKVKGLISSVYRVSEDKLGDDVVLNDISNRSVLLVGLISMLEDEFDITVPLDEMPGDITIGGVVELVESKL